MKTIKIPAMKIDGRGIRIPGLYREAFDSLVDFCHDKRGGYISVMLSPPRKPRSTGAGSQSHHLNGHVTQISQFIGDDFDDVKMHVKRKAIKRGYPKTTTRLGDVIPQHETECDTSECAILIEAAHEVADFLGMKLIEGRENG